MRPTEYLRYFNITYGDGDYRTITRTLYQWWEYVDEVDVFGNTGKWIEIEEFHFFEEQFNSTHKHQKPY